MITLEQLNAWLGEEDAAGVLLELLNNQQTYTVQHLQQDIEEHEA